MKVPGILFFALAYALAALGQHVDDPHASVLDVTSRQATLRSTTDPLLRAAIEGLHSCVATPFVAAPIGRMNIPHHYLSGSNGPTNPAEGAATRTYGMFESRITAGMNQYLATGSHSESACALAQLDAWAQARALLDYDREESSQAWYQVEWTLSSAGITDSVLVNDSTLDPVQQQRVTAWLDTAAHKDISFEEPGDSGNNHHYWRALAATAIGVTAADDKLFRFGIQTYKEAIGEIDPSGAFPKEMARHENATHYQGFALQPLVLIAQFATRQGVDLYGYQAHGRTLRDAIVFFGRAVDDPSLIKPYTRTFNPAASVPVTSRHSLSTPRGSAARVCRPRSSMRSKIQPVLRASAATLRSWQPGRRYCAWLALHGLANSARVRCYFNWPRFTGRGLGLGPLAITDYFAR